MSVDDAAALIPALPAALTMAPPGTNDDMVLVMALVMLSKLKGELGVALPGSVIDVIGGRSENLGPMIRALGASFDQSALTKLLGVSVYAVSVNIAPLASLY